MRGERLKALREKKGLTQPELAKELQISPSAVGMYETNAREPSDELKIRIADFFNVSLDYLAGTTNYPHKLVFLNDVMNSNLNFEALEKVLFGNNEDSDSIESTGQQPIQDTDEENLVIGLSAENKSVLTAEDKEEITKFAEYVANRRRESK